MFDNIPCTECVESNTIFVRLKIRGAMSLLMLIAFISSGVMCERLDQEQEPSVSLGNDFDEAMKRLRENPSMTGESPLSDLLFVKSSSSRANEAERSARFTLASVADIVDRLSRGRNNFRRQLLAGNEPVVVIGVIPPLLNVNHLEPLASNTPNNFPSPESGYSGDTQAYTATDSEVQKTHISSQSSGASDRDSIIAQVPVSSARNGPGEGSSDPTSPGLSSQPVQRSGSSTVFSPDEETEVVSSAESSNLGLRSGASLNTSPERIYGALRLAQGESPPDISYDQDDEETEEQDPSTRSKESNTVRRLSGGNPRPSLLLQHFINIPTITYVNYPTSDTDTHTTNK